MLMTVAHGDGYGHVVGVFIVAVVVTIVTQWFVFVLIVVVVGTNHSIQNSS